MTGLQAVTAVAKHILNANPSVFGDKEGRVFKYEKEKGYSGEYIAVNNLPFVHGKVSQTATVNVNVHVPALASEVPNTKRLTAIAKEVIELFDYTDGIKLDGAWFKFFSDSRPTPDNDGTFYVNIEIDCTYEDVTPVSLS